MAMCSKCGYPHDCGTTCPVYAGWSPEKTPGQEIIEDLEELCGMLKRGENPGAVFKTSCQPPQSWFDEPCPFEPQEE